MAMCTCLLDDDAKASLRISQAIDRELSQHKKESAREFKLLLLGTFYTSKCGGKRAINIDIGRSIKEFCCAASL